MADEVKVIAAYAATRAFYKGGIKSSNKRYEADEDQWINRATRLQTGTLLHTPSKIMSGATAQARVAQRDQNRYDSGGQQNLPSFNNGKGQTPIAYGLTLIGQQNTIGNCGAMACVAIAYASQGVLSIPTDELQLVASYSPDTESAGNAGWGKMTFGHSWAEFGTGVGGNTKWIVDPWAAVVCKFDEYPARLKEQLNKWQAQGKRINVQFVNRNDVWLNANDATILSLTASTARVTRISATTKIP